MIQRVIRGWLLLLIVLASSALSSNAHLRPFVLPNKYRQLTEEEKARDNFIFWYFAMPGTALILFVTGIIAYRKCHPKLRAKKPKTLSLNAAAWVEISSIEEYRTQYDRSFTLEYFQKWFHKLVFQCAVRNAPVGNYGVGQRFFSKKGAREFDDNRKIIASLMPIALGEVHVRSVYKSDIGFRLVVETTACATSAEVASVVKSLHFECVRSPAKNTSEKAMSEFNCPTCKASLLEGKHSGCAVNPGVGFWAIDVVNVEKQETI